MPHSEMGKAKMTASKNERTNGRKSERDRAKEENKNATKDKCDES